MVVERWFPHSVISQRWRHGMILVHRPRICFQTLATGIKRQIVSRPCCFTESSKWRLHCSPIMVFEPHYASLEWSKRLVGRWIPHRGALRQFPQKPSMGFQTLRSWKRMSVERPFFHIFYTREYKSLSSKFPANGDNTWQGSKMLWRMVSPHCCGTELSNRTFPIAACVGFQTLLN